MEELVILVRVEVSDIAAALPLYERMSGRNAIIFWFDDIKLAWVGSFLLLQGSPEQLGEVRRAGTIITPDVGHSRLLLEEEGGLILEEPAESPNGMRMIARHPDGAVFEYIRLRQ